jgi:YihY family inner membrane protein
MEYIQKVLDAADSWQRSKRPIAFTWAVIKKYGNDQAGYQAALVTYYGFLSLFPLLLVLSTVTTLIGHSHPMFQHDVIKSISTYFPGIGSQLTAHTESSHKSGFALIIGTLFTFYGARGVADAFRNGVNHIWWTPQTKRVGFPKSNIQSITIIIVGGLGLILASIISGFAASVGQSIVFRLASILVNIGLLSVFFGFLLNFSLPKHVSFKEVRAGAIAAAIGLTLMQSIGGFLLTRELKNLDTLYSTFAIALGLLFWIYLQAQVLFYAVEIASVGTQKKWPRSLTGKHPTAADKAVNVYLSQEI